MKYSMKLLIAGLILVVFALSGCNFFNPTDIPDEIVAEAETLQQFLPAFEAASLLVQTEDASAEAAGGIGAKTFNPDSELEVTDPLYGLTPAAFFAAYESTGDPDGDGVVRFPATGMLSSFYGSTTNNAYLELSLYDDSPQVIYKVNLYIYPITAYAVEYVHEVYLVHGTNNPWAMVRSDGVTLDATAYLTKETRYFDGRVENRTVVSTNSGAGIDVYDISPIQDDPAHADYEWIEANKEPATGTGNGIFMVYEIGSIASTGTTVDEFYAETDANNSASVSYVVTDMADLIIAGKERTVRRYEEDRSAETKKVRARTESAYSFEGDSWTRETHEEIDVASLSGRVRYDASYEYFRDGDSIRTVAIDVDEVSTGSGTYSGTYTVDGKSYAVTMDATTGLILEDGGNPFAEIPVNNKDYQYFTFDIPEGGTFEGVFSGGRLNGIIKSKRRVVDVIIGPDYVTLVIDKNKKAK